MKKGITDVFMFYGVGVVVALIFLEIFGIGAGHGLGIWFLALAFFPAAAILWTLFTVIQLIRRKATARTEGQLWANLLMFMLMGAVWVLA
jgi:hypothetical protein